LRKRRRLAAVRESLDRLLRDLTFVTLALAIALGWSLVQVAEGVSALVTGLLYDLPNDGSSNVAPVAFFAPYALTKYGGVLSWDVGGHLLTLGALVAGLVQLVVVLAVAALVYRRFRTDSQATAGPP
jgi:hypothetical protein